MIIGLVGKPNCGKSTFFKAATLSDVEIANYPFATIQPNTGMAYARVDCACDYFDVSCNPQKGFCEDGTRYVPVKMIDVAGLVPGASEGKGMGNEFLDDLNMADVLIHVIDVSGGTDAKGEPVKDNTHDPAEDIRFLEDELDKWYLTILKKDWDGIRKKVGQNNLDPEPALTEKMSGVGCKEKHISKAMEDTDLKGKDVTKWDNQDLQNLCKALRKKTKPILIAANKVDVPGARENLSRLQEEFPEYEIIGTSAESELALRKAADEGKITYRPGQETFTIKEDLTEEQEKGLRFIKGNVLRQGETGVQKAIETAIFNVLNYIPVFPGGEDNLADKEGNILPDCFLIPEGSTTLDFAYHIHSDLGDNFIQAKDVKNDINISKDHEISEGDVIKIFSE